MGIKEYIVRGGKIVGFKKEETDEERSFNRQDARHPTLYTPREVMGMLHVSRRALNDLRKRVFEPMGGIVWLSRRDWRISRWALNKYGNYEGRCGTCGRPWDDLVHEHEQRSGSNGT